MRRVYKPTNQTDLKLPLTSMVDMFTILLVFLLKSFSTDAFQIQPIDTINLPTSDSRASTNNHPVIGIKKEALILNNQPITPVVNGKIQSGLLIGDLLKELEKIKEESETQETEKNTAKKVILQVDQSTTYDEIKKVLHTASQAGYVELKLATLASE